MGSRPVRIANCSGARGDPGYQMRRCALGLPTVDFITGDYLAEMNLAENATAFHAGKHSGWEPTAWEGLELSLDAVAERGIKVVINGGSLNPMGLARKCDAEVKRRGLKLKVAAVEGDDLLDEIRAQLAKGELPAHLDAGNQKVSLQAHATDLTDTKGKPLVSANAYLGARAILQGLQMGADVIICGRVADASPVIGAAWYWHGWEDTSYDELAGALIAGHLIECSAYITGANFCDFNRYPQEMLIDLPFGIAEVEKDGSCVITKAEGTNGLVTADTVRCQFLYELQGSVYLNSDVTGHIADVAVEEIGKDRVRVSGVKGSAPPPTTKLAVFYAGGWEVQVLLNATGYATAEKWALMERQYRFGLKQRGVLEKFQILDFQVLGTPAQDPGSQFSSTTYCRVFAQADTEETAWSVIKTMGEFGMQHFSGFHLSLDMRTAVPRRYLAFYPAVTGQEGLDERVTLLGGEEKEDKVERVGHPSQYQAFSAGGRENYETAHPVPLGEFGETRRVKLGDVLLARSGDKGANVNIGFFMRDPSAKHYSWLCSWLTKARMIELMGRDWKEEFYLERMEFRGIQAVHFVVYGVLGRGVSSCRLLDALGKGFADYIRDRVVDVPVGLLEGVAEGVNDGGNGVVGGTNGHSNGANL
jgi:hypothetical protein